LEITLWYKIIITVIPDRRGTGRDLEPDLGSGTFDEKLV
jgi:hypothetical protein